MTLKPQFGIFLVPMANNPDELFQQAKIADHNGLDLLFIQDHPYQPRQKSGKPCNNTTGRPSFGG